MLSRWLPRTPLLGWLVLDASAAGRATAEAMPDARDARARTATIGATGRAVTDLRPVGKVVLDAEPALELEARASGAAIETGARVRVVEVQPSYRLVVDPEEEGERSPSLRS
jgi:membrane-bound ClpP family serine protease